MRFSEFYKELEKDRYFNFLKNKFVFFIFIFIGFLIYSVVHEFLHYYFINYFGYFAEFCWFCIPTSVKIITPLNEILKIHYFLFTIAPYLLSLILLIIFYIVFLFYKNKYIFYLAIIPAFDVFVNFLTMPIAILTNKSNDFLNLFKIGFYFESLFFVFFSLIVFLFMYLKYKKSYLRKI